MGLNLRNISMRFQTGDGWVDAIKDVSISINDGEFVCVVGPSGCGKTTLLNIIAGFISPSSGEVTLDGKSIVGPGADRAVVFQQPIALLPWLNVRDNAALSLKLRQVPKDERNKVVGRYLDMVGLSEFGNRAIYELSGGMQQRVALCRVLVNQPKVLLLDEPFGALDALTREKMQEELLKICRQTGTTAFLITHSVEEAIFLGTTVIVLSSRPGRIISKFEDIKFGANVDRRNAREIKSDPEFVALRERVLKFIWT